MSSVFVCLGMCVVRAFFFVRQTSFKSFCQGGLFHLFHFYYVVKKRSLSLSRQQNNERSKNGKLKTKKGLLQEERATRCFQSGDDEGHFPRRFLPPHPSSLPPCVEHKTVDYTHVTRFCKKLKKKNTPPLLGGGANKRCGISY